MTAADAAPTTGMPARRVWQKRLGFAALAALGAAAVGWFSYPGSAFTGRVLLQTRANPITAASQSDDRVQFQAELLMRRSFYERLVAEPSIASLPMIRAHADPVKHLEAVLEVKHLDRGGLELSLPGDDATEVTAILDMLARKHVEDATIASRMDRDGAHRKLEALAERIRGDIQARERAIVLMIDANRTVGRPREELGRMDGEVKRKEQELAELDVRIKRTTNAAKLEQLKTERELETELLATRKSLRDQLEKAARAEERQRLSTDGFLEELKPLREALFTVERQRISLQIEKEMDTPLVIRESAVAIQNPLLAQRGRRAAAFGGAAFVIALLLGLAFFRSGR